MTRAERARRNALLLRLAAAVGALLACLGWAGWSLYRAFLAATRLVEPAFGPLLGGGEQPFVVACLFDLRYECSSALLGAAMQRATTLPLYGAALALGVAVLTTMKLARPLPLYTADWATPRQLRALTLRSSDSFRAPIRRSLLLAKRGRRLLGVTSTKVRPELGHVLVCGPTRSGKSQHLMCNLLNWSGSAVVVDIKGELHRLTSGHRARFSDVVVLDPSGYGHRYDPFVDIGDSAEALQTAAEVVLQVQHDTEPVFAQRGANAVIAARRAAHLLGRPTLPYLYQVTRWGLWPFIDTLRRIDDEQVSASLVRFVGRDVRQLEEHEIKDDRFLASSWSTITSKLTPLQTEGVLKMTSGFEFSARSLLERPTTLYLRFSEAELDSNKHILRLTVLALITAILRFKDQNPDLATVPVLLGLDEAGRVHIPRLDDLVSTVAGRGVSALVYVQDLSQFEATYGPANAKTIRSNCHTQLYYPPKDLETARYISAYAGMQSRTVRSVSKERGPLEERRFSYSEARRELITPDEVRQLDPRKVVVFVGKMAPVVGERVMGLELTPLRVNRRASPVAVQEILMTSVPGTPEALQSDESSSGEAFVRA